jgi:predicted MFS family arabinose efflux permease
LVIAVLGACFDPAGYTARKALIPNAATASGIEIDSANGRHEGIFAIGWMVGPAIGSACIQWSGPMLAFAVTAAMFAIATIAVSLMHVDDEHGKTVAHHEDGHEPFFSSLRVGFHALTRDKPLFALAIGFMFLSGLYMPIDTVIFPTYFESINNATGLGALFASLAAGMVIGSFAYGRLAARFSASALLRMIMVVSTVALFPMVILPPTWLFVALGFFAGLSWGRSTHCGTPSCKSVCSQNFKVAYTDYRCRCCMPHHHLVNSSLARVLMPMVYNQHLLWSW